MTLRREPLVWFLFFAVAAVGVYLLNWHITSAASPNSGFEAYLVNAAPAIAAALGLPALFLLLRFVMNGAYHSPPSRDRHIGTAILISLAGISTWKVSQLYLRGETLSYHVLTGALLGSLLFWLLWRLFRKWLQEEPYPNNRHS